MSLISTKEIFENSGLKKIGWLGKIVASILKYFLNIDSLNKLYDKIKSQETDEALKNILNIKKIDYQIHDEDIKRIPKKGPFILVANHPLGGLDGILMMKIVREVRPDFKIIGNFLLHKISPLSPIIFAVNPFENRKEIQSSLSGMRQAYKHIKEGNALGVFPAGEVSTKNKDGKIIDREWQKATLKLIRKAQVPIVPMYFHAKNSPLFYRLSNLSPDLQTAMLPTEMMRKRRKPIKIRIGKPIMPAQARGLDSLASYGEFLQKKTYALSSFYSQKKGLRESLKIPAPMVPVIKKEPEEIIAETPCELLMEELKKLEASQENVLFQNQTYTCYFGMAKEIPNILQEIGRLREVTFREVGEGTNSSFDLDRYDQHYHHLFLWDSNQKQIVGAYRMALGAIVYEEYGIEGFYINELFNFEPEIHPFFKKCIEMGRAFVAKEYQQKPMPLFLLWRGIIHVTLRNPDHKFIVGGVSISNQFSEFSKSLMIEFMKSNYYDPFVAQYIRAKKEYKIRLKDGDKEFFFDEAKSDLNKFDKLIDELEPNILRLPVLLKKYIKQNARVVGFNVDPNFNDAVDGLMYIRVSDIPEGTVKPVLEELQKELEQKRVENSPSSPSTNKK